MRESRSEVAAAVACYVEALRKQEVEVERVSLFGSHLRGTAHDWSDIDLIVVSPDFAGKPAWERAEITGAARFETFQATGESVEALAKSPEEVAHCHPASFLADVLKDAVAVWDRTRTRG